MTLLGPRRYLLRLPAARRLVRRFRLGWQWIRPFPLPRYAPGTPTIDRDGSLDPFLRLNAPTLAAAAMSEEAAVSVAAVLDKLTRSEESSAVESIYRQARAKFGKYWRYADSLTVLWGAATLIQPSSYLEIGILRGRSAAVVAATCPTCDIYGFDLWIPDYAGAPNPGPDFVRDELRAVGHTGSVTLISGDSRETVPAFLREHPDLYFDLITIDGDHTLLGAATDLANTLPRLKVRGAVVYDDILWPPTLGRVWEKVIQRDGRYASWEFTDAGYGVAAAIRIGDKPTLAGP